VDCFFTLDKLQQRLDELARHEVRARLDMSACQYCSKDLAPAEATDLDAREADWREIVRGESWGTPGKRVWFRVRVTVPKEFAGMAVELRFLGGAASEHGISGYEAMAYVNGRPLRGVDHGHPWLELVRNPVGGEQFMVALNAYSSAPRPPVYYGEVLPAGHLFGGVELVAVDENVRELCRWLTVLVKGVDQLDEEDTFRRRALRLADGAVRQIDFTRMGGNEFGESVRSAVRMLADRAPRELGPQGVGRLNYFGHAHIDTAWLWRVDQTRRKIVQTFCNVL